MSLFKKIFSHNWIAILYFNFKMLPFGQAIYLPFDFYYGIRFENLTGSISLRSMDLRRGLIKIGGRGSDMFSRCTTIIDIKGLVVFNGTTEIGHGCLLRVEKGAVVNFGREARIGALTKIFCCKSITFGNEIDFSWECQIFDSNFHYIRDLNTNKVDDLSSPIIIGSYNWFGNRITVMKSTNTPDNFICASNSICNHDYTDIPQYTIVGGYPAKILSTGKKRVFENLEDISKFNL